MSIGARWKACERRHLPRPAMRARQVATDRKGPGLSHGECLQGFYLALREIGGWRLRMKRPTISTDERRNSTRAHLRTFEAARFSRGHVEMATVSVASAVGVFSACRGLRADPIPNGHEDIAMLHSFPMCTASSEPDRARRSDDGRIAGLPGTRRASPAGYRDVEDR
jgi:hypothetical protein